MEFWEGAVLVVGGVILVGYFTKNSQAAAASSGLAATATGSAGTTNASNLTNITNEAGGYPTIAGEPLEPPQPPVGAPSVPITVSTTPAPTPIKGSPVFGNIPRICPAWGCGGPPPIARPITSMPSAPVKGTAIPARPTPAPVISRPTMPYSPITSQYVNKSAPAPTTVRPTTPATKVTFSQAVPNLPARAIDQHMEML